MITLYARLLLLLHFPACGKRIFGGNNYNLSVGDHFSQCKISQTHTLSSMLPAKPALQTHLKEYEEEAGQRIETNRITQREERPNRPNPR